MELRGVENRGSLSQTCPWFSGGRCQGQGMALETRCGVRRALRSWARAVVKKPLS